MPDGRINIDTKIDNRDAKRGFQDIQEQLRNTSSEFKQAKKDLLPYRLEIVKSEIEMLKFSQSMKNFTGTNEEFMQSIRAMAKTHKAATDNMMKNNSVLMSSFIRQATYFMAASTHAEKLKSTYEITNPALAKFSSATLGAASALQRFVNSGNAAQLALEALGPKTNAKAMNDFTMTLNKNLMAVPYLAIGAAAAFGGLTAAIAKAAYKTVPALGQAVTDFKKTWSDALQPFITVWGTIFAALVRAGTEIGRFFKYLNTISPIITILIFSIGYLATAIFLLLIPVAVAGQALIGLRAILFTFAGPLAAMASMFSAIIGPALAIAAAIAVVSAAIWYLWKNNETFRNGILAAWAAIKDAAAATWNWIYTNIIGPVLTEIWGFVKSILTQIRVFWQQNGDAILSATGKTFGAIWQDISTILGFILGLFKAVWPIASAVVSTAWNVMKAVIQAVLGVFLNTVKMISALINGDFAGANRAAGNIVRSMATGVINSMSALLSGVTRVLGNLGAACYDGLARVVSYFSDAGGRFMSALADGIRRGIGQVTGAIEGVTAKLRNFLPFSPAKEGPLKVLDKLDFGGPIALSIDKARPEVAASMQHLFSVPQLSSLAGSVAAAAGTNAGVTVNQNVQFNNVEDETAFKRKLTQANRALALELQTL